MAALFLDESMHLVPAPSGQGGNASVGKGGATGGERGLPVTTPPQTQAESVGAGATSAALPFGAASHSSGGDAFVIGAPEHAQTVNSASSPSALPPALAGPQPGAAAAAEFSFHTDPILDFTGPLAPGGMETSSLDAASAPIWRSTGQWHGSSFHFDDDALPPITYAPSSGTESAGDWFWDGRLHGAADWFVV